MKPEQHYLPIVSVIMPIRNEARHIRRSLRAILAQDYRPDHLEVLLVDGQSEDETCEIVRQVIDLERQNIKHDPALNVQSGSAIVLLDNLAQTTPAALNIGLRRACGEVIILVGGHCEIAPDYVRRCVEALRATDADCVGGPMVTVGETGVARAIALAQSAFFGVGGVAFRTGRERPGYVDTVAFGAYRREVFSHIGNFDEELVRNQDDEFNFRIIQAGGKIWLDPSICSLYYSRASIRQLWRQYFQYGLYKVLVIQKRGAVPSWRHIVPGAFVLSLLGSLVLASLTRSSLWMLSITSPYVAANALASLWTARRNWSALPLLPLIFLTLHLAYGTGFLWGTWRWMLKQRIYLMRVRL